MGIYLKIQEGPDALYPVATVRGSNVNNLVEEIRAQIAQPNSDFNKALSRYYVQYTDADGDLMPINSSFQMRISEGGELVDFTQNILVKTVSATTQTLDFSAELWVFTGSSATVWTLPTSQQKGEQFIIKNRGSATITLQRGGSQQIYDTSAVTSITITAGNTRRVVWDNTYWLAL